MLNVMYFIAAAVTTVDPLEGPTLEGESSKLFGHNARDVLLLAGMGLALAATLFLYAYVTRKKRRATIALSGSRPIYRAEEREDDDEDPGRRRYRKRRRRENHPELLPRNPTLQETGGLPPLRPEEPAEPTQ